MTDEATRAQIAAANPKCSTWLAANAGSGKTRVLTDRVALLLLNQVPPQRILCLTYTKAAAAEMQNRLFKRLGEWAMMPDAELQASLLKLGVGPGTVDSELLRAARRLFAKAIETPGGLKIQTIHSFCAALLRRFPLEAGLSPNFREMDDRNGKLLRAEVLETVGEQHPRAFAEFTSVFANDEIDGVLQEISSKSEAFAKPFDETAASFVLGVNQELDAEDVIAQAFLGGEQSLIDAMLPALKRGGKSDIKLAEDLSSLSLRSPNLATLARLEPLLLSSSKAKVPFQPKGYPPTAAVKKEVGSLADDFEAFQARIADVRPQRLALESLRQTKALHGFARPFLAELTRQKSRRGWVDFDDLIRKARDLLQVSEMASWVLYKLDGGIDHFLVDEAQDTSPIQWEVVRLLAQEFTAGQGRETDTERTIFVVGDQKQSIYSFQGADPAEFERMRDYFEDKLAAIDAPFAKRELLYSFRSAKPILDLVDEVFTPELREGMGGALEHKAFKSGLPGRVDLWDWIEPEEPEDELPWHTPLDRPSPSDHSVKLAEKIAAHIKQQLAHGQITMLDGDGVAKTRRIRPKDFLILVQSRSKQKALFHEIIRACKRQSLPMAGTDRLRVSSELGVKDLISLLSFLETPQDDLSLAEVLRSPIGALSEGELFDLAHGREDASLWYVLDQQKARFPQVHKMLEDMLSQVDFLRPYELLERVLTNHDARQRLLARLGQEAEEGVTALLDQALNYESSNVPSLTGFLTWLDTDDVTIKREMSSDSDLIRVMTVHGAKGLEAPIVILPNTGKPRLEVKDSLIEAAGLVHWRAKAEEQPPVQQDASAELKRRQHEENMRLLYVALTRAESQLIVCGSGEAPKGKGDTWYEMIEAGMQRLGAREVVGDVRLRLDHLIWPGELSEVAPSEQETSTEPLPAWAVEPALAPDRPPAPKSPSKLNGAKIVTGVDLVELPEAEGKARGSAIHKLLETLPETPSELHKDVAERIAETYAQPDAAALLDHAWRVLDAPELAAIFAPGTLYEVDISAQLSALGGAEISGSIDRLIVSQNIVLAVDFKSNRVVPETPEDVPDGLLRQMGAYAAALEMIYPDKKIETAIVWTETAEIMPLPHDIVRSALESTHIS